MTDASSKGGERHWAKRVQRGDEQAFEQLFRAYYARLCAFAAGYVGSYDAARDVVQDVFLNLWIRRGQWTLHASVKSYLYQAVRNRSLNQRREEARRAEREQAAEPKQAVPALEDEYHRKELEAAIWEAVGRLPERRRQAFVLHRWHGLTYREIARVMGTRPKTVENQIGRALKFLRERLPPEYF